MPNFWRTGAPRILKIQRFTLSMSILGQKACILGPTIFRIPQPNWHYWVVLNISVILLKYSTFWGCFVNYLVKIGYITWSSFCFPDHSYRFLQYLGYIILITTLTMQKRSSNVCLGLLLVARNSLKGSAHPCFFMGDGKRTTTIVANSSTICGSTWRPS